MITHVTGIILAGGKSRRMGKDKAFLPFGEKPLIEIVMDTMVHLFEDVIVVVSSSAFCKKYEHRVRIETDIISDCGPLGGIHTGLLSSHNPFAFVIACDMPFLNEHLPAHAIEKAHGYQVVVPEYRHRLHPLCALYSKSCLPVIEQHIAQGKLKIKDILGCLRTNVLQETEIKEFDPKGLSFININTDGDYQSWLKLFRETEAKESDLKQTSLPL